MKHKRKLFYFVLLVGWVFLVGAMAGSVRAQDERPSNDGSCVECHENLYVLYDTGKWHCLWDSKVRCTECHGGVVGAIDKETAHTGMIANPLMHDAVVCQSCHPQEFDQKVASFAQLAGIHAVNEPVAEYEIPCSQTVASPFDALLSPKPIEPWRLAGLGAVLGAFIVMFIFAVRPYLKEIFLRINL